MRISTGVKPPTSCGGLTGQAGTIPFPVGRQDLRKAGNVGAVTGKTGGIGISGRLGDAQADVARAPVVGEADIEQRGREGKLGGDPGMIEQDWQAGLGSRAIAGKELLGASVTGAASHHGCAWHRVTRYWAASCCHRKTADHRAALQHFCALPRPRSAGPPPRASLPCCFTTLCVTGLRIMTLAQLSTKSAIAAA